MEHRLSALLQLHLQWTGQRQLEDQTRNIYVLGLGAFCIRELTVPAMNNMAADGQMKQGAKA